MAEKHKTSFNVEKELWQEFTIWVVRNYGSSRKMSEALADAIRFFMKEGKGPS